MTSLKYVAIGPCAFGFGDTRDTAVANCKKNVSWSHLRDHFKKHGVVVRSYAYAADQDLSVAEFDGALSWKHPDKYDVRASVQEHVVKRG